MINGIKYSSGIGFKDLEGIKQETTIAKFHKCINYEYPTDKTVCERLDAKGYVAGLRLNKKSNIRYMIAFWTLEQQAEYADIALKQEIDNKSALKAKFLLLNMMANEMSFVHHWTAAHVGNMALIATYAAPKLRTQSKVILDQYRNWVISLRHHSEIKNI